MDWSNDGGYGFANVPEEHKVPLSLGEKNLILAMLKTNPVIMKKKKKKKKEPGAENGNGVRYL